MIGGGSTSTWRDVNYMITSQARKLGLTMLAIALIACSGTSPQHDTIGSVSQELNQACQSGSERCKGFSIIQECVDNHWQDTFACGVGEQFVNGQTQYFPSECVEISKDQATCFCTYDAGNCYHLKTNKDY